MIDIAFYDGARRTIDLAKASGVYEGVDQALSVKAHHLDHQIGRAHV